MLDYVVDALMQAAGVDHICVVGDVPSSTRYTKVLDQGGLFENLTAGLEATGAPQALVLTCDIPFITPEAIDDFIERSLARSVDLTYPIVSLDIYLKRFAEMKRTTVRLREGVFTGGNIMLLRTAFITSQRDQIRRVYAARKDVLRLGALLGPGLLCRLIISQLFAPGVLSLAMAESAAGRLLGKGSRVAAIITEYAEIGTDVDRPEDIQIAKRILATSNAGRAGTPIPQ
jgi:GTP:adenosylcobinamide-phosphate guanylyltransferase